VYFFLSGINTCSVFLALLPWPEPVVQCCVKRGQSIFWSFSVSRKVSSILPFSVIVAVGQCLLKMSSEFLFFCFLFPFHFDLSIQQLMSDIICSECSMPVAIKNSKLDVIPHFCNPSYLGCRERIRVQDEPEQKVSQTLFQRTRWAWWH
jgi:hypothetical protein